MVNLHVGAVNEEELHPDHVNMDVLAYMNTGGWVKDSSVSMFWQNNQLLQFNVAC